MSLYLCEKKLILEISSRLYDVLLKLGKVHLSRCQISVCVLNLVNFLPSVLHIQFALSSKYRLTMGPTIVVFFLFAKCLAFAPPTRGTFDAALSTSTPNLVEGDIAVPVGHLGAGIAPEAFLSKKTNLWPRGVVYYKFETYEWDGVVEPVFLDSQMENITQALQLIMHNVPCIKFL